MDNKFIIEAFKRQIKKSNMSQDKLKAKLQKFVTENEIDDAVFNEYLEIEVQDGGIKNEIKE